MTERSVLNAYALLSLVSVQKVIIIVSEICHDIDDGDYRCCGCCFKCVCLSLCVYYSIVHSDMVTGLFVPRMFHVLDFSYP